MVRPKWIRTLMAALASTGLAVGQGSFVMSAWAADHAGNVILLQEEGKQPQRCRVLCSWKLQDGTQAHELECLDNGEKITITEGTAAKVGDVELQGAAAVSTRIYHWGSKNVPPAGTPLPPGATATVEAPARPAAPVKPDDQVSQVKHESPFAKPVTGTAVVGGASVPSWTTDHPAGTPATPTASRPTAQPATSGQRLDWNMSSGKWSASKPSTETTTASAPSVEQKTGSGPLRNWIAGQKLPQADSSQPDPLLHPAKPATTKKHATLFSRIMAATAQAKPETAGKEVATAMPVQPPVAGHGVQQVQQVVAGDATPVPTQAAPTPTIQVGPGGMQLMGVKSVMAAYGGTPTQVQYVNVPIPTAPDLNQMPKTPPVARVPNAPQPNMRMPAGMPGMMPPGGPMNAFAEPQGYVPGSAWETPGPQPNAFTTGSMPPAAGGRGALVPPGYPMPGMPQMAMRMPSMPHNGPATIAPQGAYGPVMQPVRAIQPGEPVGTGLMPVGYRPASLPEKDQPKATESHQSLCLVLQDSVYPSHREWAVERLVATNGLESEEVQLALIKCATEDPADTVRAACVRSLADVRKCSPVARDLLEKLAKNGEGVARETATMILSNLR